MYVCWVDSIEEDQIGILMLCCLMFYMYFVIDVKFLSLEKLFFEEKFIVKGIGLF